MIIFVPSGRKNGEEASTSQMTSIAVLCASVAAFIWLITVLVWHRLRNGGEEVNNRRSFCSISEGKRVFLEYAKRLLTLVASRPDKER